MDSRKSGVLGQVPAGLRFKMATVKIYKYDYTDTRLAQPARAKRMGTKDYIESVHGWIVEGSEIEVDASKVDADGKTEVGVCG
jgi:hypothetical protein